MYDFIIDVKLTSDQASFMAKALTVYSAYKRDESLKFRINDILKELAIIVIGKESDSVHMDINTIPIIHESMGCYCFAISQELSDSTYTKLIKLSEDIVSVINERAVECVDIRFGTTGSEGDLDEE